MAKKVSITTFNCGKAFPFDDKQQIKNVLERLIPGNESQDIYAFGFQELVQIWEGSFPNTVQSKTTIIVDNLLRILELKFPEDGYKLIGTSSIGAIVLITIGKESLEVSKVAYSSCRRGMYYSSLKGSAAIYFNVMDSNGDLETFVFICCHLNANEGEQNLQLRVEDSNAILDDFKSQFQIIDISQNHVFFFGDLNFRVQSWNDINTNYNDSLTISILTNENDELVVLKNKGVLFQQFNEAQIIFPPTYKYYLTDKNEYNKKRVPSWCDRILYTGGKELTSPESYQSIQRTEEFIFTDHQAVNLTVEVPSISTTNSASPVRSLDSQLDGQSIEEIIGNFADLTIGYGGWFLIAKRGSYWLAALFAVYVLYKMFL